MIELRSTLVGVHSLRGNTIGNRVSRFGRNGLAHQEAGHCDHADEWHQGVPMRLAHSYFASLFGVFCGHLSLHGLVAFLVSTNGWSLSRPAECSRWINKSAKASTLLVVTVGLEFPERTRVPLAFTKLVKAVRDVAPEQRRLTY